MYIYTSDNPAIFNIIYIASLYGGSWFLGLVLDYFLSWVHSYPYPLSWIRIALEAVNVDHGQCPQCSFFCCFGQVDRAGSCSKSPFNSR